MCLYLMDNKKPDIFCAVALSVKVARGNFKKSKGLKIMQANKLVKYLKDNIDVVLKHVRLDKASLSRQVHLEAACSDNQDVFLKYDTVFS